MPRRQSRRREARSAPARAYGRRRTSRVTTTARRGPRSVGFAWCGLRARTIAAPAWRGHPLTSTPPPHASALASQNAVYTVFWTPHGAPGDTRVGAAAIVSLTTHRRDFSPARPDAPEACAQYQAGVKEMVRRARAPTRASSSATHIRATPSLSLLDAHRRIAAVYQGGRVDQEGRGRCRHQERLHEVRSRVRRIDQLLPHGRMLLSGRAQGRLAHRASATSSLGPGPSPCRAETMNIGGRCRAPALPADGSYSTTVVGTS